MSITHSPILRQYVEYLQSLHSGEPYAVYDSNFNPLIEHCCEGYKFYLPEFKHIANLAEIIEFLKHHQLEISETVKDEIIGVFELKQGSQFSLFNLRPFVHAGKECGYSLTFNGYVIDYLPVRLLNSFLPPTINYAADFDFTKRQQEVAFLFALGKNYREIAECLTNIYNKDVSHHTIGNMARNMLYKKVQVYNKSSLFFSMIKNTGSIVVPEIIARQLLSIN